MMSKEEIIKEIKEDIIILFNCTDDSETKEKLNNILNGWHIKRCRCPMCGEKLDAKENSILEIKIL